MTDIYNTRFGLVWLRAGLHYFNMSYICPPDYFEQDQLKKAGHNYRK